MNAWIISPSSHTACVQRISTTVFSQCAFCHPWWLWMSDNCAVSHLSVWKALGERDSCWFESPLSEVSIEYYWTVKTINTVWGQGNTQCWKHHSHNSKLSGSVDFTVLHNILTMFKVFFAQGCLWLPVTWANDQLSHCLIVLKMAKLQGRILIKMSYSSAHVLTTTQFPPLSMNFVKKNLFFSFFFSEEAKWHTNLIRNVHECWKLTHTHKSIFSCHNWSKKLTPIS